MPVMGIRPRVMPMFSNTWNSIIDMTPMMTSMPYLSRVL